MAGKKCWYWGRKALPRGKGGSGPTVTQTTRGFQQKKRKVYGAPPTRKGGVLKGNGGKNHIKEEESCVIIQKIIGPPPKEKEGVVEIHRKCLESRRFLPGRGGATER